MVVTIYNTAKKRCITQIMYNNDTSSMGVLDQRCAEALKLLKNGRCIFDATQNWYLTLSKSGLRSQDTIAIECLPNYRPWLYLHHAHYRMPDQKL